jgi:flavin reductase (DIM6/NTAB) family NADH-FMN oxidoreductase RutF
MKIQKEPGWPNFLFPSPVVLVTCLDEEKGGANIITLAWVSNFSLNPPTIGVGIGTERYSYKLIDESLEFVVNIPSKQHLHESDFCGVVSGKKVDKFSATKFTVVPATKVRAPLIKECPVNFECRVSEISDSGSHGIFLGKILVMHVDEEILTPQGNIDYQKVDPILYLNGEYWSIGEKLGAHGISKGKPRD